MNHQATHHHSSQRVDYLLWGSLAIITLSYILHASGTNLFAEISLLTNFFSTIFELLNRMWWGIGLGILSVGLIAKIPRSILMGILGKGGSFSGIIRATLAGVFLDLCSHGILLVGMQLYKKGASIGQTVAFLIASPWNSLSLTLILLSLIGLKWTAVILGGSLVIAIASGLLFDKLAKKDIVKSSGKAMDLPTRFSLKNECVAFAKTIKVTPAGFVQTLLSGLGESKMVLRWIFFGIVLAAAVRVIIPPEQFQSLFGPTIGGLGLTMLVATILEVCSEGSVPLATEFLTRAGAPGNTFAFLMTGVSTDYTEILALKETTRSWKTALFLPLVTLPQVVAVALLLNGVG